MSSWSMMTTALSGLVISISRPASAFPDVDPQASSVSRALAHARLALDARECVTRLCWGGERSERVPDRAGDVPSDFTGRPGGRVPPPPPERPVPASFAQMAEPTARDVVDR